MSFIKHKKVSSIPDGLNAELIQPSDWNEEHEFSPPVTGLVQSDGAGNVTGVQVTGVLVDPAGTGNIVGVASSTPDTYLRRGATDYEFGALPAAPANPTFTPPIRGLIIDKLGNNTFSGVDITGIPVAPLSDNNYVGVSSWAEGQYLRRGYNTGATPVYEFAPTPYVISSDFAFIAPGLNSIAAAPNQVINLNPMPTGIIAASSPNKHYIVIIDAIGGNEVLLITAATASSITVTPAVAHSAGNYTVRSATSGIQEAIHFASTTTVNGLRIFMPAGRHVINERVFVANGTGSDISLEGGGIGVTELVRGVGSTTTFMLYYNSSTAGRAMHFRLSGMRILNGQDSTLAYIDAQQSAIYMEASTGFNAYDVEITNGFRGFHFLGSDDIWLDQVSYVQEAAYTPIQHSFAGCLIEGNAGTNVRISNSRFIGKDMAHANYLSFGLIIRGTRGIFAVNNQFSAGVGVYFHAGNLQPIANVYINNCNFEFIKFNGVEFFSNNTPFGFLNIKIANCRIYGGYNASGGSGISLTGDADVISIVGNDIFEFGLHGIIIQGIVNYEGVARRSVVISSNNISSNNAANDATGAGIRAYGANPAGLCITGNVFSNRVTIGNMKYAIYIDGLFSSSSIVGNTIIAMQTSQMLFPGTTYNQVVIVNNKGIDDIIPSPAMVAATSITIPPNPIISISGPTAIRTILGGWAGRRITLIFTDAAPGGLSNLGTPPGSILTSYTVAQYKTISLLYDGSYWI